MSSCKDEDLFTLTANVSDAVVYQARAGAMEIGATGLMTGDARW